MFETTTSVEGEALPSAKANDEEETVRVAQRPSSTPTSSVDADDAHIEEPSSDVDSIESSTDSGQADQGDKQRYEEVERDGKKAKVPAWLKPELMMQANYSRKTQDLAEARRGFEAERDTVALFNEAELSAHVNLQVMDRQIEQLSKTDWNASFDSDAAAAQKAFFRFQLLKDARRETQNYIEHLRSDRISKEQARAAKRMEECNAELAKRMPEWSPAAAVELKKQGMEHFHFSASELDQIDDPRIILALNAAVRWIDHDTKQRKAQAIQQQQTVRPASKPGGVAPPPAGLDDRLSAEEWMRQRNAQIPRIRPLLR